MTMSDSPVTQAAEVAAGAADDARPDNRVLLILAADHRDSLERGLYGLTAPPRPAQAARISADKLLVYQALLNAAAWLPAQIQRGVLIDEQYGASVAELASHSAGAVSLCMPLEASGQEWFRFAYGDDWQRHAGFFTAEQAKVLVRDNPGLDPARREQQARRLGPERPLRQHRRCLLTALRLLAARRERPPCCRLPLLPAGRQPRRAR
jgi:myo-inositol catabolism protein IolC